MPRVSFRPSAMRLCFLTLALACIALPASAQSLDSGARPVFGTFTARADGAPAAADLTVRTSQAHPDPACPGRLGAGAPDMTVDWGGGDLAVWTRTQTDATLTVITPDGDLICDDDTEGTLPVVAVSGAAPGRYAVWLGTFEERTDINATLYAGAVPDVTLDPAGTTQAGELSLSAAFADQTRDVSAAGQDRAEATGPDGAMCAGYVRADRPALRVRYAGGGPLVLAATGQTDLVLFADTPAGLVCNDDRSPGITDPRLVLDDADAGDYTVWVGTWGSVPRAEDVRATLTVSAELVSEDEIIVDLDPDQDMTLAGPYSTGTFSPFDPDADPALRVDFEGGETLRVPVPSGAAAGDVPNPVQGGQCRGFLPDSPSLRIDLDADGPLALRAESEADLVLAARLPDGTWMCSDDADGRNPGIQIDGAQRGRMMVWVGTFSASDPVDAVVTLGAGTVEAAPMPPPPPMPDPGGPRPSTPYTPGAYSGGLDVDAPQRTLALDGPRVRANVVATGTLENPLDGGACVGFVSAQPSAAVAVPTGDPLRIRAYSATDAVMVVRTPSGDWFCSDDAEGTEPEVMLDGEAGTYSVWLGTFSSSGDPAQMTLTVARADG